MKKVICNKANNPKCPGCSCDSPHQPKHELNQNCAEWNLCYDDTGRELFRVRCIDVESKQGQKILETKNNVNEFQVVGNISNSKICIRSSDKEKLLYIFTSDKLYYINYYGNVIDDKQKMIAQTQRELFEFLYEQVVKGK